LRRELSTRAVAVREPARMPDDAELKDLSPHDLMDRETARLDDYFSSLEESDWEAPSACEGWSVHDVLSHLAASEAYNHACLDDTVGALFEEVGQRGVTDMHSFNALGVSDRADTPHAEVLDEWRVGCRRTRTELRERSGSDIATSVGPYPADWQAWHLASELATHGDDVGVPVGADEVGARTDWRARFSRFALAESKPDLTVVKGDEGTAVTIGDRTLTLDDPTLVAAVSARVPPGELDDEARAALSALA
jgi:uncharacterized protein (TIGR03083 family)